jgi:hypothetical protein
VNLKFAHRADEEATKRGEVFGHWTTPERREKVEKIVNKTADENCENSENSNKEREKIFLKRMELLDNSRKRLSSMRKTKIGFVFRAVEKIAKHRKIFRLVNR